MIQAAGPSLEFFVKSSSWQLPNKVRTLQTCLVFQILVGEPMNTDDEGIPTIPSDSEFPRFIHQIWLGARPLPETAIKWRAGYATQMHDWEYRLWRDDDVRTLAENALCPHLILNESMGTGLRSDVMRYEILRQHGGIYLDTDVELLRPLDEIILPDCLHFGLELHTFDTVGNAILGSPAGHPFWEFLLRRIRASVRPPRPQNHMDVIGLTGPQALCRAVHSWLDWNLNGHPITHEDGFIAGWLFDHGDIVAWSREAVYPYHFTETETVDFKPEDFPQAYAAHHWHGEWKGEKATPPADKSESLPEPLVG